LLLDLGGGGVELAYTSATSRPYLGYISAASRLGGGGVELARHVGGGDGGAVREALHLVERGRAVGRLQGRCRGDAGEMQGRCRGDIGEI
jgi:hypothetical protein